MRHPVRGLLLVIALVGACAGCRTRLPVDRPPAPEADIPVLVRELAERASPAQFEIAPDRLRDLVRYRPLARPGDGPLGFVIRVDTCVPGSHDR